MADARPPPAAETPSASALMGSYPIDEDALRRWKRLHDDGVIDDDEFKRRKAVALGLAVTTASTGALSRLPEDVLRKCLSFLVVTQDDIATGFLENMRETRDEASDLSGEWHFTWSSEMDDHVKCVRNLLCAGTVGAKKIVSSILLIPKCNRPVLVAKSSFGVLLACKDLERLFCKLSSPDLRSRDDRAMELKWQSWVSEFEEMMKGIDAIDNRHALNGTTFRDLGHNIRSSISGLEAAHLSIIDIMLAVDGLDFSYMDDIGCEYLGYRFSCYDDSDDSA